MLIWYRNSFLASVVSIAGSGAAIFAVIMLATGEIMPGIAGAVIAAGLLYLGKKISEQKSFDKWWKQVEKANLEPEIRQSRETAVAVYRKNPEKRTLEKIRKLNPGAARYIENGFKEPASMATPKSQAAAPVQQPVYQPPVQQQTYQPPVQQSTYQPPVYQAPVMNTQPVQPKEAYQLFKNEYNSIDEYIEDVAAVYNGNSQHDPEIYRQCVQRLDMMLHTYPDNERLQKVLANALNAYAIFLEKKTFDDRRKAYKALMRALTVEKNPSTQNMDIRKFNLYMEVVRSAIQAVNADNLSQMEEAAQWLRTASGYSMIEMDDRDRQYQNVAVPSARLFTGYWLARAYLAEKPANKQKARAAVEEGLQACAFALIRQCDLNPARNTDLTTVLTREEALELWRSTAE